MKLLESRIRSTKAKANDHGLFRNEDGAIDLASVMVGIIVIGLIGGVIAATVFAVIPWAQDNAAKQQLESIHTAENAYYGFTADVTQTLGPNENRNSFTDSAGLSARNLLSTAPNYCVVATLDGQDYLAFSKSGSGTVWVAKNSNKTPVVANTAFPCSGGGFDKSLVSATFPLPPLAYYTKVYSTDFEDGDVSKFSATTINDYPYAASNNPTYKINGLFSLRSFQGNSGAQVSTTYWYRSFVPGAQYRVTFLAKSGPSDGTTKATFNSGTKTYQSNVVQGNGSTTTIQTVTMVFTPMSTSGAIYIQGDPLLSPYPAQTIIDDFKLEQLG